MTASSKLIISERGSSKDFMTYYGNAMAAWGAVEHALCRVFLALVRSPHPRAAGSAFFAVTSFRDKTSMIDALTKTIISDRRHKKQDNEADVIIEAELKSLLSAIRRTVSHRNKLAHLHFWINHDGVPYGGNSIYDIARLPIDWELRSEEVVTEKQIRDFIQGFHSLTERLDDFAIKCRSWPSSP